MKNLSSRVISGVIALLIFIAALYFGQKDGALVLCLFVVIRGSFEVARMFFSNQYPKFVKRLFVVMTTAMYLIITQDSLKNYANIAIIFSFVLVASFGVLFHRFFKDLDQVLTYVAKNCLGLIYICFLPATVAWIIQSNNGLQWFICLLAVVFAGDVGAYIFGVNFGKSKIAPNLSPNKSIEGALGGLFFSVMASLTFKYFIPETSFQVFAFCGFLGGFFGQIGDFFESLIKRVSGVKDSGSIMPGHGGVLDRLDGVLLAAPIFFFITSNFSS